MAALYGLVDVACEIDGCPGHSLFSLRLVGLALKELPGVCRAGDY